MRFLPALLLFAAPLLAQEPSERERRAAEEDVRATDKRTKEIKRIEEMRAKMQLMEADLRTVAEELRQKTDATREEAMEAIKRAYDALDEILPLYAETLELATELDGTLPGALHLKGSFGARTLYLGTVGAEVISGSADGTDYSLKSLGDGKYELTATKRADDGKVMEETKDQGTLKELQKKYAFLKSGLAIQVPAAPVAVTLSPEYWAGQHRTHVGLAPQLEYGVRHWADANAWGGGGKVGVTVLPPSEDLRFHLQLPEGAGFIVQQVVPGSRAEEIGIRRMDVLLKLDGELIDSPIQLKKLHGKAGILEIIRRSEMKKIDLATVVEEQKPAEAPAPVEPPAAGAR